MARGDGIYPRGRKLYMSLKVGIEKWKQMPTPFSLGQEEEAKAFRRKLQEQLDAGTELAERGGDTTVKGYAKVFLDARTTKGKENDRSLLETWVYPVIGAMEIATVRPRHIKHVTDPVKAKRAPKTVRNVYSIVQALFREAALEGLIEQTPCILTEAHLGKIRDGKKGWRRDAIYQRAEVEALISDPRIPQDRRVFYALESIGCLRTGEACGLRWGQLEAAEPLSRLKVVTSYDTGDTKTGDEREMPVHPVLAAMLAEWKLSGWPREFGRAAGALDLVVPHTKPTNRGPRVEFGGMRSDHDTYKRLRIDCDTIKIRRRRQHDLRRSGITLYREDGADKFILHRCTHGAGGEIMERYSSFQWPVLCAQVISGKFQRRTA